MLIGNAFTIKVEPMAPNTQPSQHRVSARAYRPTTFADLIGQDELVRALTNGITQDRLPHAFLLHGVRGVGKTTTARLVARALNCIGTDGQGGPTITPCGQCEHCEAIAQDRHLDVVEMDAASHTGVEDVREVIEAARYKPISARYKIYIIDEVHMLSKSAFNALLKTLEEPPQHVKFIFATTELRRVPDTVLSRCMRFDLKRIPAPALQALYTKITRLEGKQAEPAALEMIARAADGSARDGLSMLDQAMALSDGIITQNIVRKMLGRADGQPLQSLLNALIQGDIQQALTLFDELVHQGCDVQAILNDLLRLIHHLSLAKTAPAAFTHHVPADEQENLHNLGQDLSVATLARLWQMLLKGCQEVGQALDAHQAGHMILIRIAYLANTPTPQQILASLEFNGPAGQLPPTPKAAQPSAAVPSPESREVQPAPLNDFRDLLKLLGQKREMLLQTALTHDVHLVSFAPGKLELRLKPSAPKDLIVKLQKILPEITGMAWVIEGSQAQGQPTFAEQRLEAKRKIEAEVVEDPLVKAALQAFPGSQIQKIDHQHEEEIY